MLHCTAAQIPPTLRLMQVSLIAAKRAAGDAENIAGESRQTSSHRARLQVGRASRGGACWPARVATPFNLRSVRVLGFIVALLVDSGAAFAAAVPDALEIYDRTTGIVSEKFYDRSFRGLPWEKMVADARAKLTGPTDGRQLTETINDLLRSLRVSHTQFLSAEEQEYWALKSIFSRDLEGAPLPQIGAWFASAEGRWFIRCILAGSPAEKAGLARGDEIVAVNGRAFEPVRSFADSAGQAVSLTYRRARHGAERVVEVTPELRGLQSSFLAATLASRRIVPAGNRRVGYFHLWAGTHPRFREALIQAAQEFSADTDAFILDLRDGFGGCAPSWLNPFFDHDEAGRPIAQVYAKPLVVLINGGTRSGKEWLAFILKKTRRATLVGARTAGHFIAGQPFEIEPGRFMLYLAVNGDGPPGVAIEGIGVAPDANVDFEFPYSAGSDPQLAAAIVSLKAG
jgi:carboxyl-terminal processing protease